MTMEANDSGSGHEENRKKKLKTLVVPDANHTQSQDMTVVATFAMPTASAPKPIVTNKAILPKATPGSIKSNGQNRQHMIICDNPYLLQQAMKQVTVVKGERRNVRKPLVKTSTSSRPLLPRLPAQQVNVVLPSPTLLHGAPPIGYLMVPTQPQQQLVARTQFVHMTMATAPRLSLPITSASMPSMSSRIIDPAVAASPTVVRVPQLLMPSPLRQISPRPAASTPVPQNATLSRMTTRITLPVKRTESSQITLVQKVNSNQRVEEIDLTKEPERPAKRPLSPPPKAVSILDISFVGPTQVAGLDSISSDSLTEVLLVDQEARLGSPVSDLDSITSQVVDMDRPFEGLRLEISSTLKERDSLVSALPVPLRASSQVQSRPTLPLNWINTDSSNHSLGPFTVGSNSTTLPVDADSQLSISNLVNESSIDLVAKFADLAEHVVGNSTSS